MRTIAHWAVASILFISACDDRAADPSPSGQASAGAGGATQPATGDEQQSKGWGGATTSAHAGGSGAEDTAGEGGAAGVGGAAGGQATVSEAALSARKANEAFNRAHDVYVGWEQYRDASTGLYPQNNNSAVWSPENSAADLWPFFVLATYFTDRPAFDGTMRQVLEAEKALTSRVGVLPDDFDLASDSFLNPVVDMPGVVFGAAEYVKDGLLPIAEVTRDQAYFDRMTEVLTALCAHEGMATSKGFVPSDNIEVNGDILLSTTRLYAATGDKAYLDCSRRIAELYLFEKPVIESTSYRLRDHGGEITAGLVEAYVGMKGAGIDVTAHREALKKLLDRILEVARNEDGLFVDEVDLKNGVHLTEHLADTWGYVYNAFYTYHLVEGEPRYRDEVVRALGNLPKYRGHEWEGASADGYADSIESAINLLNREPVPGGLGWVESEIAVMWSKQRSDGVVEAWHGDGNFARTSLMYALMHTKGTRVLGYRPDLRLGASLKGDTLEVHLSADEPWQGALCFDHARHAAHLKLPIDYPRLNQFPEWYVVDAAATYAVESTRGGSKSLPGEALIGCVAVGLEEGSLSEELRVRKLAP